ncbi:hypothetical protein HX004_17575 [Myroides sp. 1354]|uniref:hypothetical protein n=2 Tax=Myroides TaxID=76831 RepID=UPI0025750D84|nr:MULTISPECIES: hypothetical protein [unclassified Myroides]MDM1045945.1 hypothetical protein [Myroides sp. R163-1]MDM1057558.1 hypothetical protein [Myroides sp. 1354]MDM1070857.1 hypothetical protein [Myroides sp. 1372]
MEYLRDKVMLSLAFIVLFGTTCLSQNNYNSNIVLLVDDTIVTQKIDFDFYKKDELFYTHSYALGNPLIVSKDLLKGDDVVLKFNYWQGVDKYEYAIDFSVGWIDNTSYTIIKVYNLDKEMYREIFCKEKGNYVIEIKNSVYDMQIIKCKELKCN